MGRQIRFFMAAEDEQRFAGVVLDSGAVFVRGRQQSQKTFDLLRSLPTGSIHDRDLYIVHLDDTDLLRTSILANDNTWLIDDSDGTVIQFIRSWSGEGELHSGRLWIDTRSFRNQNGCDRDVSSLRLFERLQRHIRNCYKHDSDLDSWLGEGAALAYKLGVDLKYP